MSYQRLYLLYYILRIQAYGFPNSIESRIVKGYKITINHYPHSVFLHFEKSVPTVCGASLILEQFVITAAHCFDEIKYHKGKIIAFLGASIPVRAEVVRRIRDYRIHPRYDAKKGRYNLGLALLNKPVPLGHFIKKIPIGVVPPKTNDSMFSSGWGKQVPDKIPDYSELRHLKVTRQRLISERQCRNYTKTKISSAYWCTVSVNGYHYVGDAGNGLVTKDQFLVGVVSYMINEATIYTNVVRESEWIRRTVLLLQREGCHGQDYTNNVHDMYEE